MDTSLLLLVFATAVTALITLLIKKEKCQKLPPGPRGLPVTGNLHQLGPLPHHSLQRLSTIHGPLMSLQLGSIPTLVVSSAVVAREIFKTHDVAFSGRPQLYAARKLSYGCRDMTFAPYGDYWRQLRRVAVLELLSHRRVQSFQAVREEEVAALMRSIAGTSPPGAVNLSELTLTLMNDVTCRVAFGGKYAGGQRLHEMLMEAQALLGGFWVADYIPWLGCVDWITGMRGRLERNFRDLDELYDRLIDNHLPERRKETEAVTSSDQEDLVDVLLRLREDPSYADIFGSMDHIKGLLADVFIAGTDNSAATVIWTMTELLKNPNVMRKAQEEVRSITNIIKTRVKESDLSKLHYLKLVIKESLRLHPPTPLIVPRETTETCKIQNYTIPAGTRVFINARAIGRDPNCWEEPEHFVPERFVSGVCQGLDFKGQDFQFLPFGVGRRSCPGIGFSMVTVELVLANLLCWFDWKLLGGDEDMEEAPGITMHKKSPLWVVATPFMEN